MLEKVIRTTEIGLGGLLAPEQSDRFLDYMFDATVLGAQVRVKRMRANTAEIDRIRVGERIVRGALEAVDTGENAGVAFSKISLTTRKIRLDWELSSEALEDNIEGNDLEDHIARMMAAQAGTDLEDLAINGDSTSNDPLLRVFDGWRKQLVAGMEGEAANVVDANGEAVSIGLFNRALKAMPRKFLQRRGNLRFYTGTTVIQDWIFSFVDPSTQNGNPYTAAFGTGILQNGPVTPEGAAGFTTGLAFGVTVQEVPLFNNFMTLNGRTDDVAGDHGDIWLTYPQNLIWAVKRDLEVYREFKPKKDSIEYTVYARVGTRVENAEAAVVVENVKTGD